MKELKNILVCVVLLGVIIYWGPTLWNKITTDARRSIEEQAGIPVMASWREANGPGKVLILQYLNKEHPLVLNVLIQRPRTGERKEIRIEMDQDQHKTYEIGWLEGWSFALGDTVRITSGNYKAFTATLN